MLHGAEAVSAVLNGAQHYPVKGVYTLSDYPDRPAVETFLTGWQTLDELYKVFAPSFTVITGLPGSGKSTWLTHLLINLAEMHGWRTAIFSPEMPVVPHLRDKMRRIAARRPLDEIGKGQLAEIDKWLSEYFCFIDHDAESDDEDITIDWLMERAADAVLRYGIRALVIDPWNEVEHAKDQRESMTDYINRVLRQLKKLGQRYELAIYIIAHPTKDVGKDGKSRVPTLYDIADSSAWFNKPDIGIVIDRPNQDVDETMIYVKKVRFEGTGNKGAVKMRFDRETSRYELLNPVEQDLLSA
jgi:twinkle protein